MTTDEAIADMTAILNVYAKCLADAGFYMPAFATLLRIEADRFADKFPDDVNGGKQ